MSEPNKKPGVAFWLTVVLLAGIAIASGYLGAYFYMVTPAGMGTIITKGQVEEIPLYDDSWGMTLNHQETLEKVFRPAHWLDKKIRPDMWFIP